MRDEKTQEMLKAIDGFLWSATKFVFFALLLAILLPILLGVLGITLMMLAPFAGIMAIFA